ncbi:hypothetical protein CIB84_016322 [Bambusicola thoracicus]|uniref:Uncharacterized protein n=1 Tax=Bambusicola thoracicus TaxID=9083 RepID=A0A2P4S736_BAMTH|nr:hypothetical protein CIB84_016322 [Bambusicola thoracicus]
MVGSVPTSSACSLPMAFGMEKPNGGNFWLLHQCCPAHSPAGRPEALLCLWRERSCHQLCRERL